MCEVLKTFIVFAGLFRLTLSTSVHVIRTLSLRLGSVRKLTSGSQYGVRCEMPKV